MQNWPFWVPTVVYFAEKKFTHTITRRVNTAYFNTYQTVSSPDVSVSQRTHSSSLFLIDAYVNRNQRTSIHTFTHQQLCTLKSTKNKKQRTTATNILKSNDTYRQLANASITDTRVQWSVLNNSLIMHVVRLHIHACKITTSTD